MQGTRGKPSEMRARFETTITHLENKHTNNGFCKTDLRKHSSTNLGFSDTQQIGRILTWGVDGHAGVWERICPLFVRSGAWVLKDCRTWLQAWSCQGREGYSRHP